jgi:hypothetical protein
MIIKDTRQLGSFRRGIDLYVPKRRVVSAAPSGIPVATTNSVIVSNSTPTQVGGTYSKQTPETYRAGGAFTRFLIWNYEVPNRWTLINFSTGFGPVVHPTWSDQTQIPTSGWPNGEIIAAA